MGQVEGQSLFQVYQMHSLEWCARDSGCTGLLGMVLPLCPVIKRSATRAVMGWNSGYEGRSPGMVGEGKSPSLVSIFFHQERESVS